jgi:nucleoside-diphosphate-sugar epimerase
LGHLVKILTRDELESGKKINFKVDYIFHLAAYGQHSQIQTDIDEIYNTNIIKTLGLLKSTNHLKYKAFINIGTSSEYGFKDSPMKETDSLNPEMFYAASKVASTMLCKVWAKQFNKPIVTVRPFSLYGPGEANFRFIPKLMECWIGGKKFCLSEGSHDWLYVDDFVDALFIIAKNIGKIKGGVVNVGTGKQTSNKEIVNIIQKYMINKPLNIEYVKGRYYDTKKWVANNKLIKSLGWRPKTSLRKGLENVGSYYLPL